MEQLTLPLDPDPHLAAVLLVTSSRAGPRLVLHYPPEPSSVVFSAKSQNDGPDPGDSESEADADSAASSDDENDQTQQDPRPSDDVVQPDDDGANPLSPPPSRHDLGYPVPPAAKSLIPDRKRQRTKHPHRLQPLDTLDKLFGVSRDGLAKLMAPSGGRRAWNGRRLEVGARGRTFVGCPVFLRSGEEARRRATGDTDDLSSPDSADSQTPDMASGDAHSDGPAPSSNALEQVTTNIRPSISAVSSTPSVPIARRPVPDRRGFTDHPGRMAPGSLPSNASEDAAPTAALTMFNIVLVLAPPPGENAARVELIFDHLVRPLSQALRDAQRRDGWVDAEVREAERWMSEWKREQGDKHADPGLLQELDEFLQARSHLHRMLSGLYRSIAANEVAYLDLRSTSAGYDADSAVPTLSLQIPQPLNTPYAPTPAEPLAHLPGLPISSAALTVSGRQWLKRHKVQQNGNGHSEAAERKAQARVKFLADDQEEPADLETTDEVEEQETLLDAYDAARIDTTAAQSISPHAALLLLQDAPDLITQITESSSRSGPLTPLRAPHPLAAPLSYLLHALTPRRTLAQLARMHLPGLTLPDITALSCMLIRLRVARAVPPLHASSCYAVDPNAQLQRVAPDGSAHAAFAARFGADARIPPLGALLARLRTAGPWADLIPSKDAKAAYMDVLAWLVRAGFVVQVRTFAWVYLGADVQRAVARDDAEAEMRAAADLRARVDEGGGATPGIEYGRDHARELLMAAVDSRRHERRASDAGSSTGSVRTAVRAATPLGGDRFVGHASRASVDDDGDAGVDGEAEERGYLLQSLTDCSHFEVRCLAYIASRVNNDDGRRLWPRLVKYFDGETAVEEIAGIEGMKRKAVAAIVGAFVAEGVVRVVRHW